MKMLMTDTVNRVVEKEVLVQTVQGDVLTVRVDRNETLASFKKRLQHVLTIPLDKSHIEFGSMNFPLSETYGCHLEDGLPSPQMHTPGGLREVPHGAPVLLKTESKHKRSMSSPNLSLTDESFLSSRTCASINDSITCLSINESQDSTSSDSSSTGERVIVPSIQLLRMHGNRSKLNRMCHQINRGFDAGIEPQIVNDGLGGCYIFKNDQGNSIAIVKPTDEEPLAPNNPKGFVGRALGDPGLKPTVRVGETALREAAAYLLDHDHFAKVPCTSLAKVTHSVFNYNHVSDLVLNAEGPQYTKLVSIQEFVSHDFEASDVGTAMFPSDAVHRIGILDIRLFNTDRHSGNILVAKKAVRRDILKHAKSQILLSNKSPDHFNKPTVDLIPIDHGFCLPETLETAYFEWLHWPQSSLPFNEQELEYISCLDTKSDIAMLQRELPMLRVESLRTLEVSTTLLKLCAKAGLNLAEIGSVMSRPITGIDDAPSELERLCVLAKQEVTFAASINSRRTSASLRSERGDENSEDEFHMFEMDDLLSPVRGSNHTSISELSCDGLWNKESPRSGEVSPSSTLKVSDAETEEIARKSTSESRTLARRHSSYYGDSVENSPWMGAAASVAHTGHMNRYATKRDAIHGKVTGCKPLNCGMPSSEVKDLFSNMDSEMWQSFMSVLVEEISDSLKHDYWRHGTLEGAKKMLHFGTSCPDF